jgi:hypothetical protein
MSGTMAIRTGVVSVHAMFVGPSLPMHARSMFSILRQFQASRRSSIVCVPGACSWDNTQECQHRLVNLEK